MFFAARASIGCALTLTSLALAIVGCSVPSADEETLRATSAAQKTIRVADVMSRAQEWVDLRVPYCGGVRGGSDVLCGGTCNRPSAPWNAYRSDCSGYVSWAWQIPDVPTTYVYINDRSGDDGWRSVDIDDMKAGDAVVCDTHIKLFSKFAGNNSAEIYEESDCGLVAQKRVQSFSRIDKRSFRFNGDGRVYHAIRRNGISNEGGDGIASSETFGEGTQTFLGLNGQQHYFGRTPNGELAHAFWDPNDRKVHHDVWGAAAGTPATFMTGDQQHAFARSNDGALEHWWWSAGTKKMEHDTWGRGIASDPSVILMGGGQHAFATDADGKLQHWYWTPKNPIKQDVWGEGLSGRPTTLASDPQQHVFARGTNNALEHYWWSPSKGVEHDTWAEAIASEPVARLINGDQHVFAVDAQGALQHWWWGAKTQRIEHDTWAQAGLSTTDRPAILTHGIAQHIFARGTDGAVEHYWWSPEKGVQHDTWGEGISDAPSTMLVGDDEHVFAHGADGSTIEHWWWTKAKGIQHDKW